MTREELTTIIGLLDKVEDKRLIDGTMWDADAKCFCAQGAICPRAFWEGREHTLVEGDPDGVSWRFVTIAVRQWAKSLCLSHGALNQLEAINDSVDALTPEERYVEVMKELRKRLEACS
jgi:hypothetical protein